jgi:exodeoxyribonuclease V alpha subunit
MTEREDLSLAEGFARHASRWAATAGAPAASVAAVARAASALSLAVSEGHVCLRLSALATAGDAAAARRDVAGWRAALLASAIVGTPEAPGALPLILDADDRLYLHRYFDYERRLALRLTRRLTQRRRCARNSPSCSPPMRHDWRAPPTGSNSPRRSRCAAGSP